MKSYGRNAVTMADGSKWFVRAANHSVGHGMSCDLIVADEMWDISREVIDGGLLPAQRAKQSPLLSLWSTAGTEASTAMLKWREQGLRAIDTGQTSSVSDVLCCQIIALLPQSNLWWTLLTRSWPK
jgi:hypothetical protein